MQILSAALRRSSRPHDGRSDDVATAGVDPGGAR